MLEPERMDRVRILGMRSSMPAVIGSLHRAGVLEIREMDPGKIERDRPLEIYEEISAQLVRMRAIASGLKRVLGANKQAKLTLKGALKLAGTIKIEEELENVRKGIEGARSELEQIKSNERALREIERMDIDFSKLNSNLLAFRLGLVPQKGAKALVSELHELGATVAQSEAKSGDVALLVAVKKGEEIQSAFDASKFQEIPLTAIRTTPKKTLSELSGRKEKLAREQKRLEGILEEMSEVFYPQIIAIQEALEIEADRAQIATKFGKTEKLFVVEGWVPKSSSNWLKSSLEARFKESVHVLDAPDDGTAPTKLANPKIAHPFEGFMDMFSLPKYNELDPTLILFITLPLLYGLIVGDAAYGVISFLLAFLMVRGAKEGSMLKTVGMIWMYCAIPTLLFGIIFDEYAGYSHTVFTGAKLYTGFHRLTQLSDLMLISLIIGMVHLALGFIIGFQNERHHNMTHALGKLGWIPIEIGGVLLITVFMFGALGQIWGIAGAMLFIIGAILVYRAEGAIGLIEIPSLAGNIMSYLRLAIIGLVGVILAEIINTFAPKSPAFTLDGILIFLITALFYVTLHVAHTGIAMFEALIQGGRLNVVEFFGKFYHGNGARFAPFSYVRKYTCE
jgi:V/A-type H+-transporting ATPase subunit I